MADQVIAVPLPDGRWLALEEGVLRDALSRAEALGFKTPAPTEIRGVPESSERWLTSTELGEVLKVHSTTLEAMAKAGTIPSARVGKLLRFKASLVEAAIGSTK
jgi:excisionase family DNA binding protein